MTATLEVLDESRRGIREGPSTREHAWWRWFLALLALGVAWTLITPVFSGEDESGHVIRAAAMARGDVTGHDVATVYGPLPQVRVPGTLLAMQARGKCYLHHVTVTPRCAGPLVADKALRPVITGFARYPPLYYALVAAPIRFLPSETGVYLMRLIALVACAALLATAFASAQALGRWGVLGVAVATTPMVPYFSGVVYPSSLEITAAIALWASAAALARGTRVDAGLVARTAILYALCVNTRGLSLLFASIAVAGPLLLASSEQRRAILRVRHFAIWCAVAAAGIVTSLAWSLYRGRFPRAPGLPPGLGFFDGLARTGRLIEESIAWFASFEVRVPATIFVWSAVAIVLLVIALASASARDAIVLVAVAVIVVIAPVVISMLDIPPIYAVWLGRVGMPLTVGLPIMAGTIAATRSGPSWTSPRWTVPILASALAGAELYAFCVVARRWSVGTDGPVAYFLDARWKSPVPASVELLLAIIALTLLTYEVATSGAERHGAAPVGGAS